MAESGNHILITRENHIKTITLNQPKRKNAISQDMALRLVDIMEETKNDDSRVIIFSGAEGNFCSGADLDPSLMNGKPLDLTAIVRTTYNPIVTAIRNMNKIFIAKVQGTCVGVGFSIALACDMIYASEDATFSQIFTRIGLSSDGGGAYFLPEKVGYHKAFELMATNKIISADEALNFNIVNHVLPNAELDDVVDQMADQLASGPFVAIRNTKANLRAGISQSLEDTLETEAINQGISSRTEDFFEGVLAFIQKRKPNFKGK